MPYEVIRSHEICAGHRVVGHESKCRHLHGHNYVFHFHVAPKPLDGVSVKGDPLDQVGRVIDFSVVKSTLCEWLETNWDHRFLHWEQDKLMTGIASLIEDSNRPGFIEAKDEIHFFDSLVSLPFNPTAENLAAYMVEVIGPRLLDEHGVELVKCTIEETSKCHVGYTK
ncbi:6-carboxy-5,6,7,8-tetrahydropterin synthase [Klebsiella phage vB_KppS-Raw]|nr:6-carboxy-5,6,7,8-tetrahydropterin synthase [Klebsiella phage vB_KppS-Raw]CAD5235959.1 6-carboxy-5,6,7,8-tetrahydropterin synthase [Klebsiella phage vB_KppS-Eggy]